MTNNIATCSEATPSGFETASEAVGNGHCEATSGSTYEEKPPYSATTLTVDLPSSPPPAPSGQCQATCKETQSLSLWAVLHLIALVIASSTINGVVFGVVNNFGVFYAHLTELYKTDEWILSTFGATTDLPDYAIIENATTYASSNATTNRTTVNITMETPPLVGSLIAGIGSLNIGLIFFCSIFASVLSDRYGIRAVCLVGGVLSTIGMYASSVSLNIIYLYITYGLVLGIGASLVYAPSLAILGLYFDRRLGLVNGLVTAGSSAFSIVMPIMLRWLIDTQGIPSTFRYLSFLMASLVICALTFKERRRRPETTARKSLANMFFYDALWKNNLYLCWLISIPIGLFGYFVPFCHLVKHADKIGSVYRGEILVMSIGIFSMIGRLITGQIADISRVNRIVLQQMAFASIGVLTMMLTFVTDLSLLLVCCGLGLFDGTFISLLGPIAFDLVGKDYANQAIGLLLCFCSLPLTVGPPIAAYSFGIYGDYKLAFFVAGLPPLIAAAVMFNITRLQRKRNSQQEGTKEDPLLADMNKGPGERMLLLNGNGTVANGSAKLKSPQFSGSQTSSDVQDESVKLLNSNSRPQLVIVPLDKNGHTSPL